MVQFIATGIALGALVAGLLAFVSPVSEWLVRSCARRLPATLSERMEEEWLAELDALASRPSQLAFAVALSLTRRHSFAIEEDGPLDSSARPLVTVAALGGWPSVVMALTLVCAGMAYAGSFLITPMYRSAGRMQVVPSRMPDALVQASVRQPWQDALRHASERVLSAPTLEPMIRDARLYGVPQSSAGAVGDAVLARMRRDIDLRFLADGQSFEVGYRSSNPQVAQTVARRIFSLYLEISNDQRGSVSRMSGELLDGQIAEARAQVLKQTADIEAAKRARSGELDARKAEHEMTMASYRALVMERERYLMERDLSARSMGEGFRLMNTPEIPKSPISPNRSLIAAEGAAAGFVLGLTLIVAGRHGSRRKSRKTPVRMIRVERWPWVAAYVVAGAAIGLLAAATRPQMYRSEALVAVPEAIPTDAGATMISAALRAGDMDSLGEAITSRAWLEHLIKEFNLYPDERRHAKPEAVFEQMRRHIEVVPSGPGRLRVAFTGADPWTTMQVAERNATAFVQSGRFDHESSYDHARHALQDLLEDQDARLGRKNETLAEARESGSPEAETLAIEPEAIATTMKEVSTRIEKARQAADLEHRRSAEQFRIVVHARMPDHPISPRKPAYAGAGGAAGLAAGLLISMVVKWSGGSNDAPNPILQAQA